MVSNRVGHKKAITRVTPVIAASVFILSVSLFVIVCVWCKDNLLSVANHFMQDISTLNVKKKTIIYMKSFLFCY